MHSDSRRFSGRKNEVYQKIMETCSKVLFLFVSMCVCVHVCVCVCVGGGGGGEGTCLQNFRQK